MKEKKFLAIKQWVLLICFVFFFLVLQSSEILTLFSNAKPVLIFPFAISCSLFLKKENVAVFAVICGFFLDCFSTLIFGFSSFILLFLCVFTASIVKKYIRICFINILILNFLLFLIYCFIIFIFKYLISEEVNEKIWNIWLYEFLPTIIYTTLSSILIFLISKKLCYNSKFHIEKSSKKNIKQKGTKYEKQKTQKNRPAK